MRRGLKALAAIGACAAVAGCATLPATDVTATGATFNARGITGPRALDYWFEYSRTTLALSNHEGVRTPTRLGPANTSWTTIGEPVTGLAPDAIYYYRACGVAHGADPNVQSPVCLPHRAVATDGPVVALCGREPVCETIDPDFREVTDTTAIFRGRGFAGTGPAEYWFEYSGSRDPDAEPVWQQTPHRTAPTSETELRETVSGLTEASIYKVRLCGRALSETTDECFETMTFRTNRTVPPVYEKTGGTVRVTGSQSPTPDRAFFLKDFDIDVHSGPHGEDPGGHVSFTAFVGGMDFLTTGRVSCVDVKGSAATVNVVEAGGEFVYTVFLEDHGAAGDIVDSFNFERAEDDCGPRTLEDFFRGPLTSGGVEIEPAAG